MTADDVVHRLRRCVLRVLVGDRLLLRSADGRGKIAPYDGARRAAFEHLARGTSRGALAREVGAEGVDVHDRLLEGGFLERGDIPHDLPPDQVDRFDRLLNYLSVLERDTLSRFGLLARLRAARVVVVGTGGLGSWIVYNLLCSGVGALKLVDADTVELSNLNRSILFTPDQVGMAKVDAARAAALRFAPATEVVTRDMMVTDAASFAPEVAGWDLVIATADQPAWRVREWVASACALAEVPLLHPSGLRVGPFYLPGVSSCPMCEWAHLVDRDPGRSALLAAQADVPAADPGALSHIGTITAGVVAGEVLRFLTGQRPLTVDGLWTMEGLTAGVTPLPPHPGCAACGAALPGYGFAELDHAREPVS